MLNKQWQMVPDAWQHLMFDYINSEKWINLCKHFGNFTKNMCNILPYDIFYILKKIHPSAIKVVILGQDPYHGIVNNIAQANGASFSVPIGLPIPPSLKNIDKELNYDLNIPYPNHGNLDIWIDQGVLLLNSILTVEAGKAGSHSHIGWQEFTDYLIQEVAKKYSNIVWLLWGSYANKKDKFIDENIHLILRSVHPSPLSAYRGFFGCKHFSQANQYLEKCNKTIINWQR